MGYVSFFPRLSKMSIEFIFASLLLALLPGPDILFVLAQSISRGFKAAFSVSLGLVSGLFVHTAAVALGVAALVAASPVLLKILQYGGVAYLVWLGISAVRASGEKALRTAAGPGVGKLSFFQFYRRGVIMNLLNPKVIIFFLSFFPGFIPENTDYPGVFVFLLGTVFAGVTLCVFSSVSFAGGWLNKKWDIARFSNSRAFGWITAVIFWAIGVWIVCP